MNNSRNTMISKNIVAEKIKYYRNLNGWSYQEMSNKLMIIGIGLSILFWTIFIKTLFYIQLVLNNLKNYVF